MGNKKVVVIGAGPTGPGAAYRLHELGYDNWGMVDIIRTGEKELVFPSS